MERTGSLTDKKFDEFLNTVNPEAKNWKYIEFRCMIQDILGNEIYNRHNSDKLSDRTIFYCITIPGENEWVRRAKNNFDGLGKLELSNPNVNRERERLSVSLVNYSFPIPDGKNKSCLIKVYDVNLVDCLRVNDIVHVCGLVEPIEFEDDAELLTNKNSPQSHQNGDEAPTTGEATSCAADRSSVSAVNNQRPINDENTNSNSNSNTTNSNSNPNPNPNVRTHTAPNGERVHVLDEEVHNDFEPAKDFPERLVPRIHVRVMKKLHHINPLLPDVIPRETLDITRLRMARARLSTILTQLLAGDSLVAEYLIISLIAKIYSRKDILALGQFTIGLSGFKPELKFLADKLYEIFSKITTHSHYIDLSIANLNNLRFTPHKDHENNKMIAGTLQLPDGLYLMLNETALSEGTLTMQGTSNLGTLEHIIRWQKHKYDFQYHSVEIDTDLKILVISEGKSLLPVRYDIRLAKTDNETIKSMQQACQAVDDFLDEELLNSFRHYVTSLMDVPEYSAPVDVQNQITEDFKTWRESAADPDKLFSGDDLASYMTLARYLTLSRGEVVLTRGIWKDAVEMESQRAARLAAAAV